MSERKPIRALLIRTDGRKEAVNIAGLEDMQKAVGGYIEAVPLGPCAMFVNEDGLARDLPVNPLATRFAKRMLAVAGRGLRTADGWIVDDVLLADGWIVGDVLLTGPVNARGNETDLADGVVAEVV